MIKFALLHLLFLLHSLETLRGTDGRTDTCTQLDVQFMTYIIHKDKENGPHLSLLSQTV
jgi:hypothetical protein